MRSKEKWMKKPKNQNKKFGIKRHLQQQIHCIITKILKPRMMIAKYLQSINIQQRIKI